jgi:autophagy-related protein 101
MREFVAEKLGDTVLSICELVNKPQYLPKSPTKVELSSVYDNRFPDVQPYNFLISYDHGRIFWIVYKIFILI